MSDDRRKERRGEAAALTALNEVLLDGEICVEIDTLKFKIGDGVTAWNALAYASAAPGHTHDDRYYTEAESDALLAVKVPTSRTVSAGSGLTGGGDLSANRTLAADFGTGAGKVTQGNDARLSDARTPTGAAGGDLAGTYASPTIADNAVTYAKMQNVSATDKLIGRSSPLAGDPEEIPCTAAGRALIDDADAAAQRVTLGVPASVDVQTFTAGGTWTKPTGAKAVRVIVRGSGGGGGGGCGNIAGLSRPGGTGGGAGCMIERLFNAADLGATETVTIGAGGAAGGAGTLANGTNGGIGGTTSLGAHLIGYGGGGGKGGVAAENTNAGGSGAGTGEVGTTSTTTGTDYLGGGPGEELATNLGRVSGGQGAPSFATAGLGGSAEYGGAGGGGMGDTSAAGVVVGGSSLHGGGGGGCAGGITAANAQRAGKAGGSSKTLTAGGGGAGGAAGGTAGTTGTSCDSTKGGTGGGGGGGNSGGTGGAGGAGGQGGGAGGGGGGGLTTGGAGAVGGAGWIQVISYF